CVALSLSLCYLLAVHLVSYSVLSCSSPPPPSSTLFPYTTLFRSPPGLIQVEQILYGQAQEGPLVPRLEKAERDVYGRTQDGSAFLVRLQRLQNMLTGAEGDIPLKMKLNAIEWVTFRSINENPSIQRRLELLESQLYGQIFNDMSLVERLDQLLQLMWPGGRIYAADATVPK